MLTNRYGGVLLKPRLPYTDYSVTMLKQSTDFICAAESFIHDVRQPVRLPWLGGVVNVSHHRRFSCAPTGI